MEPALCLFSTIRTLGDRYARPFSPGAAIGCKIKNNDLCYSLSDSSLATVFSTFLFAIQTWQTSLEHYYVYVQTYFLSQLRKMLILLINSYCKMCTLTTIRSRVFVCSEQYNKFRWKTRAFCHKKWKKQLPNSSQTDYST